MRKLERKYGDELAVVGVHSAKFDAERATESVQNAVRRYRIEHPVINDSGFAVWQSFAVRAWPTLMFLDPRGRVIGKHEGEFDLDALDGVIGQMIDEFRSNGLLDPAPLPEIRESEAAGPLRYPGKILADEPSGRLFVSDSNNDRVLVLDLDGGPIAEIGESATGFEDGAARAARFNQPQGLELLGNDLFVADTGNHALRRVDLDSLDVRTVVGSDGGLRSPWDLTLHNNSIYIAMAGAHQIWRLDLESSSAVPFAGNGGESLRDGATANSMLAQPSGVAFFDDRLYFVDSETSAVRYVDGDRVETLVGIGLFEFGDIDGTGDDVRLQHPIGIAAGPAGLFIADTYNNKIKTVDPASRGVATVAGDGETGLVDGPFGKARFSEPSGLSVGSDRIWVADTNNHVIRILDLTNHSVATLELAGP